MASTTGIELGPDSCVLAGVRQARAGVAEVRALHVIERDNWPAQDLALITTLRAVRRGKGFPRRARVVAWGLSEPVSADDPIALALIRPVTEAGFKVERVLTPPEALAQLAASRPRNSGNGAVAWLSLNMHGAAIAIVRGTELLFARTFEWSYTPMAAGSKAQLLQRYSLIAQLAPELSRGIAVVRDATGVTVDAAVTCGDLPDLRSLTMPLIEELDLEVETLDSTEGLRAVGRAKAERFAESAPIMRLACAVAAARVQRSRARVQSLLRIAAALALAVGLVWGAYAFSTRWLGGPVDPARSAPVKTPKTVAAPPPGRNPSSKMPISAMGGSSSTASAPAASAVKPGVTASRSAPPPASASAPAQSSAAPPAPAARTVENEPTRPTGPRLTPLKDPLPKIESILIDEDRRLAIVDGGIVGVGDAVGPRVVTGIDRDGVVFREPSGLVIRVRLRSRADG